MLIENPYPQYKNYREFWDEDGNKIYQDRNTGKKYRSSIQEVEVIEGGVIFTRTPAQLEAIDRKRQQKIERVCNRDLSFYFVLSEDRRGLIEPQTIARLFFLATFLHPNDNILRHDDGTLIKQSEMSKLMGLSNGAFYNFLKEVSGRYILIQSDKSISISPCFFRGHMDEHTGQDAANGYQRVFIKSLRELYRQTPVSRHRYLGFLFLILPFINWEYNLLCWNPEEKDIDKISTMSLSDFCGAIGYDDNGGRNSQKLVNAYSKLTFTFRGNEMPVCDYLISAMTNRKVFVINPYVIYRGHDRRKVESFGVFFQQKARLKKLSKN